MKNIHKKIQTASNIAIIIVALLLGGVLVNSYFFSPSPKNVAVERKAGIKAGAKLTLADVDWSKAKKNLVLVLSTSCHFCTASTPFYQKLAKLKAGQDNVRLIAVLPQDIKEAERYLSEHKIPVDEIKQVNLDAINVRGTPTLIETDETGKVINTWNGKLPPEKETEVVQRFFGGERAKL